MNRFYVAGMTAIAAAGICFLAPSAVRAQANHATDTIMVVSRTDGRGAEVHIEGRGDHCWGTTSPDEPGLGVSIGDDLCTLWTEGDDDTGTLLAKITTNNISFHLSGKAYAISDASAIKSARSLFDPLVQIADQQEELGAKQRALGEKQRELGRQQRAVKVGVPDMSADFKKVEADAKKLSAQGGTQSELGDLQSELGDLQSKLGDLQSQAGDAESKLGDQQSDLGDQQSALGDQQSDLGDKSEKIARDASDKLRAMLTQAVQKGTAKPE
jgi:bla regulator protein blaR1